MLQEKNKVSETGLWKRQEKDGGREVRVQQWFALMLGACAFLSDFIYNSFAALHRRVRTMTLQWVELSADGNLPSSQWTLD